LRRLQLSPITVAHENFVHGISAGRSLLRNAALRSSAKADTSSTGLFLVQAPGADAFTKNLPHPEASR
jgi:hypothetical protein